MVKEADKFDYVNVIKGAIFGDQEIDPTFSKPLNFLHGFEL